jgi:hypothetical protein
MNSIQVNHNGSVSTVRIRGRSKTRISRTDSGSIVIEEEDITFGEVCCMYGRLVGFAYLVCLLILLATLSKDKMDHLIRKFQMDFDSFRQSFA